MGFLYEKTEDEKFHFSETLRVKEDVAPVLSNKKIRCSLI